MLHGRTVSDFRCFKSDLVTSQSFCGVTALFASFATLRTNEMFITDAGPFLVGVDVEAVCSRQKGKGGEVPVVGDFVCG
jgi:hypothetical protein